jgi:transcriptional regulator with XRE-family HTH domain
MEAMNRQNEFGDLIREHRTKVGLSLRAFAIELGLSPTYVSGFENGVLKPPTPERLKQISIILDVAYEDLIDAANRWEDVIPSEIASNPSLMALYRKARTMNDEQLQELTRLADDELKKESDGG